ncbi:V-type ATP synthase subunit E family protein [Candidatus Methanomassiliicoccus intestinalis]|uniref:V-type ATP synthase subunit E family protein n=1 Tax=Candidatus Methanomassiliicoccus intestinalis TaxID=1406512 RepID=UPI0037DDB5E6
MSLDKIADEILGNASKEAEAIVKEAENERSRILLEADQKIENMRKAEEKELQDALERIKRQEISSAELDAKKIVLNKRKDILNRTFEEMLAELSDLNANEKGDIYKKIVDQGSQVIPSPKVFCPQGEKKLLANVDGIGELTETDMESGLILESTDGTVRLDFRFRTILEGIWDQDLKEISNILFE